MRHSEYGLGEASSLKEFETKIDKGISSMEKEIIFAQKRIKELGQEYKELLG